MRNLLIILLAVQFFSCRKTDLSLAPPREEDIMSTTESIVQALVGIKYRFAVNGIHGNGVVFNTITANGFTTGEIALKAGSNQDFNQLSAGRNAIAPNNALLTNLWANCLLINSTAKKLKESTFKVVKDSAVLYQLIKYIHLYQALSIGTLAGFWQYIPIETGAEASFVTRNQALLYAVKLLDSAAALPLTTSALSGAMGNEINLRNSLLAISARYSLMLGDSAAIFYEAAKQKASQVALSSRSVFVFNLQNQNPLYRSGFTSASGYLAKADFGLPVSLAFTRGDGRDTFYTRGSAFSGYGFGRSDFDSIPLYLPGEMLLIQAEVHTRQGNLANAKQFLDQVLTKRNVNDAFRVGAGLTPYTVPQDSSSLMTQVYRNRCIELYMTGLKLEDARRFKRPEPASSAAESNRLWYPYPSQERNGNSKTPPDPSI